MAKKTKAEKKQDAREALEVGAAFDQIEEAQQRRMPSASSRNRTHFE